jgi:hypothetical protein
MVHCISRWLMPAALCAATLSAHAQSTTQDAKSDPLDPKASVPTIAYESSFSRYRRLGDEKAVSWREANDTVARIGGWRVYTREAQQPEAAPAAKPPQAAMPAGTATPMPLPHGQRDRKTP